MKDILRFWLDKGIDGFRLDTINFISKVPGYPSVPGAKGLVRGSQFYMNGPKVHNYLQEIYRDVFSKYDIMTVGETPNVTPETAKQYVSEDRGELNMLFQFEHVNIDQGKINKWDIKPWSIKDLKSILSKWQSSLGEEGWNSIYLSNHDQARSVSRFGNDDRYLKESAKMLCTMDMTLRGTPYVYQGEELGMTNVKFPDISYYRDVQSINLYNELKANEVSDHDIMEKIYYRGRDNARTPMQWDDSANAGFTSGTPWIDVNPNYITINTEAEKKDPDSVLNYYKAMIAFRKAHPVIVDGSFKEYYPDSDRIFTYVRENDSEMLYVILNFSATKFALQIPEEIDIDGAEVAISNTGRKEFRGRVFDLGPYEAVVFLKRK